ncbi:hypothetical protein [Nocardia flavorosea]|uniref:hypothetical protein n=1 Tax=Nocardia flavorosea TaxID=53429 RepID=UPI002458FD70|nr:hypothetical protein [Nocardia flavorosea]
MNPHQPRLLVALLHSMHDPAVNESFAQQNRQERPHFPTRCAHNQSRAATLRLWHTRNRDLLERVAAGLRHLDHPAPCKSTDPVRGRTHAIHLMADHAKHDCPRFQLAARYIEAQQ